MPAYLSRGWEPRTQRCEEEENFGVHGVRGAKAERPADEASVLGVGG